MEPTFKSEKLAQDFKKILYRHRLSLRDVSKATGISYATLSRVQNNRFPDIHNYVRLIHWMNKGWKTYIEVPKEVL